MHSGAGVDARLIAFISSWGKYQVVLEVGSGTSCPALKRMLSRWAFSRSAEALHECGGCRGSANALGVGCWPQRVRRDKTKSQKRRLAAGATEE